MIKKILKMIVILLAVLVLLIALLFIRAALTPMIPRGYTDRVATGGEIEKTYLANGAYSVGYFEQKTDEDFKKYEIWYPESMLTDQKAYPLIVMVNGTGVKASKYKEQFKHFASWGFLVIGTEEEESWDAVAADKSLEFMLAENDNSESIFYHRVDADRIGVMGHSQGGAGVLNAITAMSHRDLYKAAVSLSPTSEEMTAALGWSYDLSRISIPIFLAAGTEGKFEMEAVIPTEALQTMYQKINAPKAMARKLDCEHGDMLFSADGYTTAWFMWYLQGDEEAAKAFIGDQPELSENALYIEQTIDEPD